jgi:hypothetical protein
MRPITDRAEVAIDFPEKAYMSSFGHSATFDAHAAADRVEIKLANHGGPKRTVDIHLHWFLFADVIDEIAASLEGRATLIDEVHRGALADAVRRLAVAVGTPAAASAGRQPA